MIPFVFGFYRILVQAIQACFYTFDGVNETINCGNDASLDFERTDSFSVSLWVKLDTINIINSLVTKRDNTGGNTDSGYYFSVDSNNKIRLDLSKFTGVQNRITVLTNVTLTTNIWYYLTVTYDGSSVASGVTFYVDGVVSPKDSPLFDNLGINNISNNKPVLIGSRDSLGIPDSFADCNIDEVSIYNTELTSQDVTDIYNLNGTLPNLTTISNYNSNCVSHWRMGENDEFYDYLTFNGINETINCGNDASLDFERTDSFSVNMWYKGDRTGAPGSDVIMSKSDATRGWFLYFSGGNPKPSLFMYDGGLRIWVFSTISITDDNWHTLTLTYDGTSLASGVKIYVDGIDGGVTITTNTLNGSISTTNPLSINGNRGGTVNFIAADIDEVSIYNTELSQTQITDIYNRGRNNPDLSDITRIVSHWKMENGTTVFDQIGTNDGTTVNMDSSNLTTEWNIHDEMRRKWTTFDGTNEYTNCGNDTSLDFEYNESFSLSSWVKWDILPVSNAQFIGKRSNSSPYAGYQFKTNSTGKILFGLVHSVINQNYIRSAINTISAGVWYNLTATYNGNSDISGMNMYINGVLILVDSSLNTLGNNSISTLSNFSIGSVDGLSEFVDGSIDEVSIYNTELSQTQITDIYNRGRNNVDYSDITGIVSHWKMDSLNPIDQIGSNDGTSFNQDSTNLENDINDGASVNMDTTNKICE